MATEGQTKKPWQLGVSLKKQMSMKLYESRASTEHYLPKILFPACSDLHLRNLASQGPQIEKLPESSVW